MDYMDFSPQAENKGASQTVIGLIFGCYAVCNLIGSLIMGKYVSIMNSSSSVSCYVKSDLQHSDLFSTLLLFQIVQIGAKFMLVVGLFVSSVCTIIFG